MLQGQPKQAARGSHQPKARALTPGGARYTMRDTQEATPATKSMLPGARAGHSREDCSTEACPHNTPVKHPYAGVSASPFAVVPHNTPDVKKDVRQSLHSQNCTNSSTSPGSSVPFASPMRADRNALLEAVREDGKALRLATTDLRADKEVVLAAVRQNGEALQYASSCLRSEPLVVLAAVQCGGAAAFGIGAAESLHSNRDLMLTIVNEAGAALQYASLPLRSDRLIVLAAIRSEGSAIQYAASCLLEDREFALSAAQRSGDVLGYLPDRMRADRDIVLAAVRRNGCSLRHAAPELCADRAMALEAVRSDGSALQYCSDSLRNDKEVVTAALHESTHSLKFASEVLRSDREFILAAVRWRARALRFAADELRNDRQVVAAALEGHGSALEFASDRLRADPEFVLKAVRSHGSSGRHAVDGLKVDANFSLRVAACKEFHKRAEEEDLQGEIEEPEELSSRNVTEATRPILDWGRLGYCSEFDGGFLACCSARLTTPSLDVGPVTPKRWLPQPFRDGVFEEVREPASPDRWTVGWR